MKFRVDVHRPRASSKRQEDECLYKDSFDQPFRIAPKARPVPFGSDDGEDDHDEDDHDDGMYRKEGYDHWDWKYPDRTRNSSLTRVKESVNSRDEDYYRTSRSSSTPSNPRYNHHSPRTVNFPNRDWDYSELHESIDQKQKKCEYRGGYDYHDDLDSIESWEVEMRRQLRAAQVRNDRQVARFPRAPASVFRKVLRYSERHSLPSTEPLSAVSLHRKASKSESHSFVGSVRARTRDSYSIDSPSEYVGESAEITEYYDGDCDHYNGNSRRFSRRQAAENTWRIRHNQTPPPRSSTRFDRSVDDDRDDRNEFRSTKGTSSLSSGASENPQLLHAKVVPGLPPGYLQRNDGVLISVGSSTDPSSQKSYDKYRQGKRGDDDNSAEEAAQEVLKDLRKMGYHIDDQNGILESNSDSGTFLEFECSASRSESGEPAGISSEIGGPPSRSEREEPLSRAEHDIALVVPDAPLSYGIRVPPRIRSAKVDSMLVFPITTSTRHCAKVDISSIISKSLGSREHQMSSNTSKGQSLKSAAVIQTAAPPIRLDREVGQTNGTSSDESTLIADGSTITSVSTSLDNMYAEIIFELEDNSLLDNKAGRMSSPTKPIILLEPTPIERAERTRDGDRVPDYVTKIGDGIPSAISDMSNYHSFGLSTVGQSAIHALRKESQTFPLNVNDLCDRLLLTCDIAAFAALKRLHPQLRKPGT